MERVLYRLFDYQKFEPSRSLSAVIDAAHGAADARALSEDELQIWAAGDPVPDHPDLPEMNYDKR